MSPVLTTVTTTEWVIPVDPSTVLATVEYLGENRWQVRGSPQLFATSLAALMHVREDVKRWARHPVRIDIRWLNMPSTMTPPTTGTSL